MTKLDFGAAVNAWTRRSNKRLTAVFRESAERTMDAAQATIPSGGNLPIKTGFLRATGQAGIGAMPTGPTQPGEGKPQTGAYTLVINNAKVGDTLYFGWTAAYARRMEYGFVGTDSLGRTYNQAGFGFVRLAVQNWQQTVKQVIAEAMAIK